MNRSLKRVAAPAAALALAGALAAPASPATAFPPSSFANVCQYSFDRLWRAVPMVFSGRLTAGSGQELGQGAELAVGDSVQLRDGAVSATLPSWIVPYAYEADMIPEGDGELPVRAWLALEASNTAEGVTAAIPLHTVARTHVVLTSSGLVDEERSSIVVENAPIPTQTWTATGGEVQVRQAMGESLGPLPVGRDGANVRVRGSLYVEATLTFPSGETLRLYLDCLQGEQTSTSGEAQTDAQPGTLGAPIRVPGFAGTLSTGAAFPGRVEADLATGTGPGRVDTGQQAILRGANLRVRLTDDQREAWLEDATSVPIAVELLLHGARSVDGAQETSLAKTVTVPADGAALIDLPLPETTWTAAGAEGIDISGDRVIALRATVGAGTRTLTLTRISTSDPYPFARFLRAAASPTPPPVATATPVATASARAAPAVIATVTPKPAPPAVSKVSVRSTKLKVASRRVAVSLRCAGSSACKGTVRLRTASKVKLGKRARRIFSLTRAVKYSLAAGRTVKVKLSLSKDGRSLMARRRSLGASLELRPSDGAMTKRRLKLSK